MIKNNRALRIALILCVLAIFCSCIVGTTFAKFVTSDVGEGRARVSKWGVVITATDSSSFKTEYALDDLSNGERPDTITVKSSTDRNVVAPGTKDAEGIVFTITGTPEVILCRRDPLFCFLYMNLALEGLSATGYGNGHIAGADSRDLTILINGDNAFLGQREGHLVCLNTQAGFLIH